MQRAVAHREHQRGNEERDEQFEERETPGAREAAACPRGTARFGTAKLLAIAAHFDGLGVGVGVVPLFG